MSRITKIEIAVAVVGALTFAGIAAIAPPAYADDNPYTPEPAASTESPDHGQGSYCSNRPLGALWSCEAPKLTGGGPGNTDNNAATLTPTPPAAPPSPPCDHGPKV